MIVSRETLVLGAADSQGRALPIEEAAKALGAIAAFMGRAKRAYHAQSVHLERPLADLKKTWAKQFGLTDRQFTSVRMEADGLAAGRMESLKLEAESLEKRIESAEEAVEKWGKKRDGLMAKEKKLAAWRKDNCERAGLGQKPKARPKALLDFSLTKSIDERRTLKKLIQGKRQKLRGLRAKKAKVDAWVKSGRPPICFGGPKLFRAQWNLEANGLASHEEWLEKWQNARAGSIFCVGSHEEQRGNQSAALIPAQEGWPKWFGSKEGQTETAGSIAPDALVLRLRVPPRLEQQLGPYLFLWLKNFRKGHGEVLDACASREALTKKERALRAGKALAAGLPAPAEPVAVAWRLAKKTTRRGEAWVAQASFEKAEPAKFALSGEAIGVDFNADHLALCRIDRFGNPKHRGLEGRIADIPLDTAGMASEQSDAAIGDACAKIVALARELGAIVVIEKLCFKDKKAQLAEKGAGYSRMLSSLAYSKFHETLERRCEREGAILRRVNPAFTSVIGWAKFSEGFRLTVHQAAACAIARRGMGHSEERLRSKKSFKQGRSALERAAGKAPPPARTRGKHSWADWRRAGALLRAMRAAEWKAARDALGGVGAARGGRRGKRRAWRKNPILGVGGAAKAASPRAP